MWDYEDNSHHIYSKVKVQKQKKSNNSIDRVLRSKDIKQLIELEEV